MGRKLEKLEADAFGEGDWSVSGDAGPPLLRSQRLRERIAEVLGIPVAALTRSGDMESNMLPTVDVARAADTALTRDCLDLIRAYTRISNPDERQRILALVRSFG